MVKGRHILFIVENNTVPFDRRVWAEARAARDFGYDVSIICPFDRNRNDGRDTIDGIRIYRHPRPVEGSSSWMTTPRIPQCVLLGVVALDPRVLRRPFSVIHSANPPDHVFLIALAFKIFGVKFIFDHHDLTPETYVAKYGAKDFLHKILLWMERRSLQAADLVISTNESYKKIAIERSGKKADDVIVVRNGPDISAIPAVRPDPGLLAGFRHLVGYVGIIGKQEGIENLLQAAESHRPEKATDGTSSSPSSAQARISRSLIREAKAMGLG